jgi:hypothetical protein
MIFRYQSPSPWRWLGPSCLCQFSLSNWCLKSWGKGRNQKPSLESCPHGSLQNVIVWEIFWVSLKNTPFIGATAILSVAHYHTIPLLVACVCLTIIYFYFLLGIPMFSGHDPQISHFFDGFISMLLPTYIYIYRHMADKCIDISIFTYLHIIICTYTSCTFILEYIYTHIRVNIPPRIQPRFHRGDRHVAITDPSRFAGDLQIFRRRLLGCHCFGRLWYLKKRVLQNDVSWLPGGLAIHIYEYKYNI